MDDRLIRFIRKHVKRGVHHDRIRQFLLKRGYDFELVEDHISHVLNSEKNKKYILIVAMVAVIIAVSFAGFYHIAGTNKKTNPAINSSGYAEIKYRQSLEIFNKVLISKDINDCDKIMDSGLKEQCQSKLSFNAPDVGINQSDESSLNKELLNKALISNNMSICSEITKDAVKLQCENILNK